MPREKRSPMNRYQRLRENKEMTQNDIVEKLGITNLNRVKNIERYGHTSEQEKAAYCSFFGVTEDYLDNKVNVKTEKEEIKTANHYTGLSQEAIEFLHNLNRHKTYQEEMRILNFILSDRETMSELLSNLKYYLDDQYKIPLYRPNVFVKYAKKKFRIRPSSDFRKIPNNPSSVITLGEPTTDNQGNKGYNSLTIPFDLSVYALSKLRDQLVILREKYKQLKKKK